jgi:nitrate reductase NapD
MPETHIASLLVQHRPESADLLDAYLAGCPELEVAVREGSRSIVLCETGAPRTLMDRIDGLNAVKGVMSVSLVYHHVEPDADLDQPCDAGNMADDTGAFA